MRSWLPMYFSDPNATERQHKPNWTYDTISGEDNDILGLKSIEINALFGRWEWISFLSRGSQQVNSVSDNYSDHL